MKILFVILISSTLFLFTSLHSANATTSEPVFLLKFGSFGTGDGQFGFPHGIALDGSGNIYVADNFNDRIQIFNSAGVFQSKFGSHFQINSGSGCVDPDGGGPLELGDGQFLSPEAIAVDGSGNIYVSDSNHRIQKFNPEGVFLLKFGSFGTGNGQFNSPQGIALDSSSNIYVTDFFNDRIQIFNPAGDFQSKFGSNNPQGIAFDGSGNIYVVELNNNRIQKFNPAGAIQSNFGSFCRISDGLGCVDPDGAGPLELGDGQFSSPRGIALDSSGNIYVVDTSNERIQIFNPEGVFQSKFGSFCRLSDSLGLCVDPDDTGPLELGDGQFATPRGIAVDSSGNIYVVESTNNRIQKFVISCSVPEVGDAVLDMIVTTDCTLGSSVTIPANVIVQSGAVMTIPSGVTLDIDFTKFSLTVKSGSGVLIEVGGKIT